MQREYFQRHAAHVLSSLAHVLYPTQRRHAPASPVVMVVILVLGASRRQTEPEKPSRRDRKVEKVSARLTFASAVSRPRLRSWYVEPYSSSTDDGYNTGSWWLGESVALERQSDCIGSAEHARHLLNGQRIIGDWRSVWLFDVRCVHVPIARR